MGKGRGQLSTKGPSNTALVKTSKPAAEKASKLAKLKAPRTPPDGTNLPAASRTVIPVAAEFLEIGKRIVDTGRGVRVSKTVHEREQVVDEPLNQDELHVERVAINRFIEPSDVPAIRQEEGVTVVPILEEVLVTEKRLLLKEEVRISRVRRQVHQPQRVVLRTEEVSVEHFDDADAPVDASVGSKVN